MAESELEHLTRESVRVALALAKQTWKTNPAIMVRGIVLEEENSIPDASVNFYAEDDFGGKYDSVSIDGIERWAYYPDESPIEEDGEVE